MRWKAGQLHESARQPGEAGRVEEIVLQPSAARAVGEGPRVAVAKIPLGLVRIVDQKAVSARIHKRGKHGLCGWRMAVPDLQQMSPMVKAEAVGQLVGLSHPLERIFPPPLVSQSKLPL